MTDLPMQAQQTPGGPKWLALANRRVADKRGPRGFGEHTVVITFNYDPSPRLPMYQFDALHHDVAIWSMH